MKVKTLNYYKINNKNVKMFKLLIVYSKVVITYSHTIKLHVQL